MGQTLATPGNALNESRLCFSADTLAPVNTSLSNVLTTWMPAALASLDPALVSPYVVVSEISIFLEMPAMFSRI